MSIQRVNEPLIETEQKDWQNEFKNIASEIVFKTNKVLLKTLNEHDQYTKQTKDLLDEEMAEMKFNLKSLRRSHNSDAVTTDAIVTVPVSFGHISS